MNEQSGKSQSIQLTPHLNLSDGLHYAQNVKLPGDDDQTYQLTFNVHPPVGGMLGIHSDWLQSFGEALLEPQTVVFQRRQLDGSSPFSKVKTERTSEVPGAPQIVRNA